jgi:hypothetical protein
MDLREIGFGDVDWIHWAQDRDSCFSLLSFPQAILANFQITSSYTQQQFPSLFYTFHYVNSTCN